VYNEQPWLPAIAHLISGLRDVAHGFEKSKTKPWEGSDFYNSPLWVGLNAQG
jgi:hypothetical protein